MARVREREEAALVFGSVKTASGQGGDIYFNLGTAIDKSNGQSIDTFGDGTLRSTPKMTGMFGGIGGSFMLKPTIGFGFEYFSRFSQGGYAGLNYRPKFYDFNAVWMPFPKSKYVAPEFQAGVGGASLSFYLPPQCNAIAGCSSSGLVASSRHFQTHLGVGMNFYIKKWLLYAATNRCPLREEFLPVWQQLGACLQRRDWLFVWPALRHCSYKLAISSLRRESTHAATHSTDQFFIR